ncbi:MAG TPA: hypothetical protein V6C71_17660 [Coleofasciculaceae cyanobacterium]|jgi:hypothetical protein
MVFKLFKTASIFFFATIISVPVIAHNVEISNEVAATFHIEPNHNPNAGKTSRAWFALTSRGGNSIPLSECNCALKVYAVPRTESAEPILKPELMAIDVEKYQEIPGAEIIFPQAGAYELEISGTAKNDSFTPFKLTYVVNVVP